MSSRSQRYRKKARITTAKLELIRRAARNQSNIIGNVPVGNSVYNSQMLNTTANEEIEQPESDLCNDTNVAINCNILSDDNRGSNVDNSLRSRLALWGCNHNITHSALNDLLIVLQSEVSEKLPIDARTLMKTTGNVMVERMGTGQYYYFGIGKFLVKRIKAGLNAKEGSFPIIQNMQSTVTDRIVSLSVGIDGLPVAKSNNKSFWPIIGLVDQSVNPEPFLIALYLGIDKPPVDTYLRDFVNEMHELELTVQLYTVQCTN